VIVQFGHRAEIGAKLLYQLLNERKVTDQLKITTKGDKPSTGGPSSSTLTPTDLAAPWRAPHPEAETKRRVDMWGNENCVTAAVSIIE
jgi:hypothetical protein